MFFVNIGLSQTITVRKGYSDTATLNLSKPNTIRTKCFSVDNDFGKIDSVIVDSIPVLLKVSDSNYMVYRFNLQRLYSFYAYLTPPVEKYNSDIFYVISKSYSYTKNKAVDIINHLESDSNIYYVSNLILENIKTGKIIPLRGSGIKIDKTNFLVKVKFTSYSK
jgi:hypothetical protein